jgi:CRISPR-associated protein Csd1
MSWLEALKDTYDACVGSSNFAQAPLEPISHVTQQAHIEVTLTADGEFQSARVLDKPEMATLVPCTEASAGRAGSRPVHHPLCDKLQYLASDFLDFGGEVTSGFAKDPHEPHRAFMEDLAAWVASPHSHPTVVAIHRYLQKGTLVSDLAKRAQILPLDTAHSHVLTDWEGEKKLMPEIFGILPKGSSPLDGFVRWRVVSSGSYASDLKESTPWGDLSLQVAWVNRYEAQMALQGLCFATGEQTALASQHPARLRHGADKAKLISSNDSSGYTYRGRFLNDGQACAVGYGVTQKAHNALRWLIRRQGAQGLGNAVVLAWAKAGAPVPDPQADTLALFGVSADEAPRPQIGDAGQYLSVQLGRAIRGYQSHLDPSERVTVMVLDAATPGRSAISYYRELSASDFLERIQRWHTQVAWIQNFGKDRRFVGAPSPKDIAMAAYGSQAVHDEKLRRATVERLLPCIVDARPIPRDLVVAAVRRTINRVGQEPWDWERCLGIACGLIKGFETERNYSMALEENRRERDYLFGRLLAIAEQVERSAQRVAGESRDTHAARLMQRFADRPSSTWRTIALALNPYWSRLSANRASTSHFLRVRMGEVCDLFSPDDFTSDKPLGSGFLLAYHCQRQAFYTRHQGDLGEKEASEGNDVPAPTDTNA